MSTQFNERKIDFENLALIDIIKHLQNGYYAIPIFQREFVWDSTNIRDLWDSIYRHYPIGSFLIWETEEQLPQHRNLLSIELKENPRGNYNYILDGQQRITSIIGSVLGARKSRTSFKIYFHLRKGFDLSFQDLNKQLTESPFLTEKEYNKLVLNQAPLPNYILSLENILELNPNIYEELIRQGETELARYYFETSLRFSKDYKVSIIKLNNIPIEEVCDIFTRVNQKGKKLTLVDLMVAKTYKHDQFYLRDYLDELQDQLISLNYDTIEDLVFLRTISIHFFKKCTETDILKLTAEIIQEIWEKSSASIIKAIRFLRDEFGIVTPKILPYGTMIVPLSYFFYKLDEGIFYEDYKIALKKWFWRSSFSAAYQSHTNERIHDDCKWIDSLLDGTTIEPLINTKFEIDKNSLIETDLNINNAFCNSVLCLLANKKPINFYNHHQIKIDEVLIKGKKSELHHIFPKNSNTGKQHSDLIDSVVNITFLPKDTNKKFLNKEPSDYLELAKNNNSSYFDSDLSSHFISASLGSSILENNYINFLQERAALLKDEIDKILMF